MHAFGMNLVREPDAGNPHVRFDERGAETEWLACLSEAPTRKGGNSQGSHGLYRNRAAPRLYRFFRLFQYQVSPTVSWNYASTTGMFL